MGKGTIRRMMMLQHDRENEPKRDRLEEERERREREMERRLRKLEDEDKGYRRSWEIRENNRYYDPMEYPREEPPYRGMPQIGFSANTDYKADKPYYGGASSTVKMNRPHLTHDEAEEWCDTMVNADGTKGGHWTMEQTAEVAKQRGINCDKNDFWAVMNMMYSDYSKIAAKHSVDTPGFYADLARAFLDDADAVDGKAYAYWDCISDK